jgi:hypothetical protein
VSSSPRVNPTLALVARILFFLVFLAATVFAAVNGALVVAAVAGVVVVIQGVYAIYIYRYLRSRR